jgi:hypothetical protein
LAGVAEMLLVLGGLASLAVRWAAKDRVPAADVRFVGGLVVGVCVVRALLVNHPDFYYPDFMIHTRVAKRLAREGLDALLAPAAFCAAFQAARHSVVGMPYSIAFHVPWALVDWPYDRTLQTMKLTGALISVIPVALGYVLARCLGLPARTAAVLMALAPTYPHWLFRATLPALTGHCLDLVLLVWLARNLSRPWSRRKLLVGAGLVAAAQLAYSFSVLVSGFLAALLAALEGAEREKRYPGARPSGLSRVIRPVLSGLLAGHPRARARGRGSRVRPGDGLRGAPR